MGSLVHTVQTIYQGFKVDKQISDKEIQEISLFISKIEKEIIPISGLFFRSQDTGKARTLQFANGRGFCLLNKKEDPKIVEGLKKIAFALSGNGAIYVSISSSIRAPWEELPLSNEIEILTQLKGVEGWIQIEGFATYFCKKTHALRRRVILEFCNGGNLFHAISGGKITLKEKKLIFTKLVRALARFHTKGFIHGDLKPENVLLIRDEKDEIIDVKVTDVDSSCRVDAPDIVKNSMTTTIGYSSPEYFLSIKARLNRDPMDQLPCTVTQAHDVWALGAIFFNLLEMQDDRFPFSALDNDDCTCYEKLKDIYKKRTDESPLEEEMTPQSLVQKMIRRETTFTPT